MTREGEGRRDELERALDDALAKHTPRFRPSPAFEQRLRARLGVAAPPSPAPTPARPSLLRALVAPFASALAAAAIVVLAVRAPRAPAPAGWDLADEAVSDHLRVVASTRPPEIESGGIHQVKPWFQGRVDFAPRVAFAGDDDYPLVGGSLGYVRDRKAAVFQFRRRLHVITLLVFPAAGMPWPSGDTIRIAERDVVARASRGFQALLWRDGDLAYALVSDVARPELEALVTKISPSSAP